MDVHVTASVTVVFTQTQYRYHNKERQSGCSASGTPPEAGCSHKKISKINMPPQAA